MADDTIQRKFANYESVINNLVRQMTRKNNNAKRDGQVVSRSLFADSCWGKVHNNAMTRKMQTSILHRGLHTLTTFLHSGVREPDNCDTRKSIGVIHLNFDDNSLESNYSTGKYACKHGKSVDEVMGNVN